MAELRTGAKATTGPADEDAGVTTPDVGKGARSKIDVDASSPVELANPVVEATEHDADDPAVEDATGRGVGLLESAEADSVEHELMLTSTAELDAVAVELEVAVLIDESWGAEQDTTAESTVSAAEITAVAVVLEVAATTLSVPVDKKLLQLSSESLNLRLGDDTTAAETKQPRVATVPDQTQHPSDHQPATQSLPRVLPHQEEESSMAGPEAGGACVETQQQSPTLDERGGEASRLESECSSELGGVVSMSVEAAKIHQPSRLPNWAAQSISAEHYPRNFGEEKMSPVEQWELHFDETRCAVQEPASVHLIYPGPLGTVRRECGTTERSAEGRSARDMEHPVHQPHNHQLGMAKRLATSTNDQQRRPLQLGEKLGSHPLQVRVSTITVGNGDPQGSDLLVPILELPLKTIGVTKVSATWASAWDRATAA
ncbi:unnamed protein product [Phytophthora fragariaefolia]|uniref:Unnamed protein product n=1 Tax=Phytophthora fragariaefolia TaxID=1490495 RepID=A0A9W6WUE7_9STRA|nr:unnamed protein product [Phytophthora fragariaefolia]